MDNSCHYCDPSNTLEVIRHSCIMGDWSFGHHDSIGIVDDQLVFLRRKKQISTAYINYCPKCGRDFNADQRPSSIKEPDLGAAKYALAKAINRMYNWQDITLREELSRLKVSTRVIAEVVRDIEETWKEIGGDSDTIRKPVCFREDLIEGDDGDCGYRKE